MLFCSDNNGRRPDITETFQREDKFSFFSKYVTGIRESARFK